MKFVGRCTNLVRRVSGPVTLLGVLGPGALVGGLLLANCAPGTLDCDEVKGEPGTSDFCGGGGESGNTGGGGGSGGTAMSDGPCGDVAAVRAATLEGCDSADTVAKFEADFMQPSCGKNSTCHNGVFEPKYKKADTDLFLKFAGVKAKTLCTDNETYYIDLTDPLKSFMLTKSQAEMPNCPGDDTVKAGARMPYQEEALAAGQIACLEAYVKAVAAACKP